MFIVVIKIFTFNKTDSKIQNGRNYKTFYILNNNNFYDIEITNNNDVI